MRTFILLFILSWPVVSGHAREGYVILKNGHTLPGDINVFPDGKIRVSRGGSAVYFNKAEVLSVSYDQGAEREKEHENHVFYTALKNSVSDMKTGNNEEYEYLIYKASKNEDLDSALIKAVIQVESSFNPRGVSCKGAQGLMQLMPDTASSLGVKDAFDPKENIYGGSRYLRKMLDLFDGDLRLALAAYNAGPEAVKKYNKIPPYKETQEYVRKVLGHYGGNRTEGLFYEYQDEHGCLYLSNYMKNGKYKPAK